MGRRRFVAALPALAAGPYLGATLGVVLTGCSSEPLAGPAEVKWDRDVCTRCSMVISERAYAAQIRDPMKKVHKFDDFGCAVIWKEHQAFGDAESEFWVADSRAEPAGAKWLDARQAAYAGGKRTPMGYGYAAVAAGSDGGVPFGEARKAVLVKGK
ncbi:MAG: protein NosL [Rhodocyclales bacterium]|nr:protein NosL [Rhodocyclales bacterium]